MKKERIGRWQSIGQDGRTLLSEYSGSDDIKDDVLCQMVYAIKTKTQQPDGDIVRFPYVHQILGRCYHLNRQDRYFFINEMRRMGYIKIVPYHGVKLLVGW